jgi:hypothetical protein
MTDSTFNKIAAICLALFMCAAAKGDWIEKSDIIILGIAVYGSSIFITVINLFDKIQRLEDKFFNNQ